MRTAIIRSIVLVCLGFHFPQDPDRSTPEKTVEAFNKVMDQLEQENHRGKLEDELDHLGDFVYTDRLKAALEKRRLEDRQRFEEFKLLDVQYSYSRAGEIKDGKITLNVQRRTKRKGMNPKTNAVEDMEQALPQRFGLENVGAHWLIREIFDPCYSCLGTGQCGLCKGAGTYIGQSCPSCQGQKKCAPCRGEGVRKRDLTSNALSFVVADQSPEFSRNLSTPEAAARSYAGLRVHRELAMTRKLRDLIERVMKQARPCFTPAVNQEIDGAAARWFEEGKKRFANLKTSVGAVEVKEETASAVVTLSGLVENREDRTKIVLVKNGDSWRVDQELRPCWGCQGSGACDPCKGTGKIGHNSCYACGGSKVCKPCAGRGWGSE